MKKVVSVLLLTVLLIGAASATAFAQCGRGMGYAAKQAPVYAACTVEGCDQLGLHEHDGTYYRCQDYNVQYGCGSGRGCYR